MLMTNQQSIQEVLFFPQMKPEKKKEKDTPDAFIALGVPAEWVDVIYKIGISKVDEMRQLNPGKLHQDLCGYNKKQKLGLKAPSQDDVKQWLA